MRITALTLKKKKKSETQKLIASISCLFTLGSKGYFFLIDLTVGSRRSCVNEARALLNREHGSLLLGILRTDLWSQGTVF